MARQIRRSAGRDCVVGNYIVGKQIGAGSFSTVWHARHRVHGTEVAIKEIHIARLNSKLQESLKSEIFILKTIDHPNIIHLHDMIEEDGKIFIVLEFCKGGDLSMFIQRNQGRIPESTAKHFLQQLAEGLKVLREYSLIHRDLKPQNLLLTSTDDNCTLKIADFGFARSLQPRGLAETLCGSPLYMAPEIMQLQKYDAKADLWSVGAILFQLVTGKTPFTGNNQIQLLQNIIKSNELQFPVDVNLGPHCIDLCRKLLRRNPVERLTFEEFFDHPYISQRHPDTLLKNEEEMSQEDNLPFILDSDSSGPVETTSISRRSSMKSIYGFSLDLKPDPRRISDLPDSSLSNHDSVPQNAELSKSITGSRQLSRGNLKDSFSLGLLDIRPTVTDSLESIDRDYVFVSGYQMELPSSGHASKTDHSPAKTDYKSFESENTNPSTNAPVPIVATTTGSLSYCGNIKGSISPTDTSRGPINKMDTELPSTDCISKIKSLKCCASAITELVNEKISRGKKHEAFSIQLVILAIWKRVLDTCQTRPASAIEGSLCQETVRKGETIELQPSSDIQICLDTCTKDESEKAFIKEVRLAEELSQEVNPAKNVVIPDAIELIYQHALALGIDGAVDEYMGDIDKAVASYTKAVQLFEFLLVEASSLNLKPPFLLVNSDRLHIQQYIDAINLRRTIIQTNKS